MILKLGQHLFSITVIQVSIRKVHVRKKKKRKYSQSVKCLNGDMILILSATTSINNINRRTNAQSIKMTL